MVSRRARQDNLGWCRLLVDPRRREVPVREQVVPVADLAEAEVSAAASADEAAVVGSGAAVVEAANSRAAIGKAVPTAVSSETARVADAIHRCTAHFS